MRNRNAALGRVICLMLGLFLLGSSTAMAQYFTKRMGSNDHEEGATAIVKTDDGNFIVAGYHDQSALLIGMTPTGGVLWQKELSISGTGLSDLIYDMVLDGDQLIVCGYGVGWNTPPVHYDDAFVLRFDINTKSVVWTRVDTDPLVYTRWYSINEVNGDFILTGDNHTSWGTEGMVGRFDINGNLIGSGDKYTTGNSSDDLQYAVPVGGELMVAGRVFNPNSSLCSSRSMVTAIDLTTADPNWSRYYFANKNTKRRMYSSDMIYNGQNLVLAAMGGKTGSCGSTSYDMYLAEIGTNGSLIQDHVLDLNPYTNVQPYEIAQRGNYYFIMGRAGRNATSDLFLMLVDQNFQPQWTRIYDGGGQDDFRRNTNSQMVLDIDNDAVYFVGRSKSFGNGATMDIVIHKTNLEGFISDGCQTDGVEIDTDGPGLFEVFSFSKKTLTVPQVAETKTAINADVPCEAVCGCVIPVTSSGKLDVANASEPVSFPEAAFDPPTRQASKSAQKPVEAKITAFPNPATTHINVQMIQSDRSIERIIITDLAGRLVRDAAVVPAVRVEVAVDDLPAGTYLVEARTTDGIAVPTRFVKHD